MKITALILIMSACVAVSVAEYKGYAHPRSGYVRPQTANQINSEVVKKMQSEVTEDERERLERCANMECPKRKKYSSYYMQIL